MRRVAVARCLAFALFVCVFAPQVFAHSPGRSEVTVTFSEGVPQSMTTTVALTDIAQILPLDRNADGVITWGEIERSREAILTLASQYSGLSAGGTQCVVERRNAAFLSGRIGDVQQLRITVPVSCPGAQNATPGNPDFALHFALFSVIDPTHRTLLRIADEQVENLYVLSAENSTQRFSAPGDGYAGMAEFLADGFRHILEGYDHLAFLLLLILPVAGRDQFRQRLLRTAKIVTAFTAAHSITLAAAITGLVHLPARPVEIAIAASVVLAGLSNVFRPLHAATWKIAFVFGLLHGFGFAGALQDLDVTGQSLLTALLGFNIGIELGQLAIVLLAMPLLGVLALSDRYRTVMIPGASLACAAVGVYWTVARF